MQLSSLARVLFLFLLSLERATAAPLRDWQYGSDNYYDPQGGQQNQGVQPHFGFNLGLNPFDLGINVGQEENQGAQPGFGFNLGLDPFKLGIKVGKQQNQGAQPGFGFNLGLKPFDLGINVG